ncbi:MAG: nitric oxide reductase transcriptional regulator NorR [Myxococcales bacterium]|nr:nitric oxide reductase transcriptional regulator NorR [Myxococcales bacterium]
MLTTASGVARTTAKLDRHTLDSLLSVAMDLTQSLSTEQRYQRLLSAVRRVVPCDAVALLRCDEQVLVPVAADGLHRRVMWQRFVPDEHPRLRAILDADGPMRFAADDARPDPYDGLVEQVGQLHVHSCMGCTLRVDGELVGVLTVDAVQPGRFDAIDDDTFGLFAALAAATMRTAGLIDALEHLAERRGLLAQQLVVDALRRGGGDLIGHSAAMQRVHEELATIAAADVTVLITGETGVGKELVARTVHAQSARSDKPLVYVNCAALPESIAESELFGHVRGAFTGASDARAGKFELADSGTIFLDEIGELPPSIQAKLLRVLQNGELQRVGADRNARVDVRTLAATNRDLAAEVEAGRFRADLYHRLSVYPLHVPALRERGDDVLLLARHFADTARLRLGVGEPRLSPAAQRALLAYSWPGNVRELEHVVMRAVLRASRGCGRDPEQQIPIELSHVDIDEPAGGSEAGERELLAVLPDEDVPLHDAIDTFQRALIARTVERAEGNWSEAARRLGVDKSNLHRLARRLELK